MSQSGGISGNFGGAGADFKARGALRMKTVSQGREQHGYARRPRFASDCSSGTLGQLPIPGCCQVNRCRKNCAVAKTVQSFSRE